VTEPLWRTWAVILGIIVATVVFGLLWPAYAGDAILPPRGCAQRVNPDGMVDGAGSLRRIDQQLAAIPA
jgi:hypothetical protein